MINKWKIYNKHCDHIHLKSFFFTLQKRAFKVFNRESKNDKYSVKILLEKCFFPLTMTSSVKKGFCFRFSLYNTHIGFWIELYNLASFGFLYRKNSCIHCGMFIL